MKERTPVDHAAWLYELLLADSDLDQQMTWEEFWGKYSIGLYKDEFDEGNDISHIVTEYQKLHSMERGVPPEPPTKSEQAKEQARKKRHEELMRKYPVL